MANLKNIAIGGGITVALVAVFYAVTKKSASAKAAECPAGTHAAVDANGNAYCQQFARGGGADAQADTTCPVGYKRSYSFVPAGGQQTGSWYCCKDGLPPSVANCVLHKQLWHCWMVLHKR